MRTTKKRIIRKYKKKNTKKYKGGNATTINNIFKSLSNSLSLGSIREKVKEIENIIPKRPSEQEKTELSQNAKESPQNVNELRQNANRLPPSKVIHELFVGCMDMTNTITVKYNTKYQEKFEIKYTEKTEDADICMKKKGIDCTKHKADACKYISKSNRCIPDYDNEKYNSIVNTLNLDPNIQNHSFKFNSNVDGKIINIVKTIRFQVSMTLDNYHIIIYEVGNIRCICFPPGIVDDIKTIKYYNREGIEVKLSEILNELLDSSKTNLICGHSMGGAMAQYMCSLDWPYKDLKEKSILITAGAFGILDKKESQGVLTHFKERCLIYATADKRNDTYSYNSYITMHPEHVKPIFLPVRILTFEYTGQEKYLNELKFKINTNVKNFSYKKKKFNPILPHITNTIHHWSAYRNFILNLLNELDYDDSPPISISPNNNTNGKNPRNE